MAKKEEKKDEIDPIFTEWTFNDLAGNLVTVKPWSFNKTIELTKLIGDAWSSLKSEISDLDYTTLMSEHLDLFLKRCPEVIAKILYRTVDKDLKFLDHLDIPMSLEMLEVIMNQNFFGDRAAPWIARFMPPSRETEQATEENLLS